MSALLKTPVLVLNASYEPINITGARRAILLLLKGAAQSEEDHGVEVYSNMLLPAVIRLREYHKIPYRSPIVGKKTIAVRDKYTCQYCGIKLNPRDITLDHIFPQSRGGRSTWENQVVACGPCNKTKDNRTPEEAGMTLARKPKSINIHTNRYMLRLLGEEHDLWSKYL